MSSALAWWAGGTCWACFCRAVWRSCVPRDSMAWRGLCWFRWVGGMGTWVILEEEGTWVILEEEGIWGIVEEEGRGGM